MDNTRGGKPNTKGDTAPLSGQRQPPSTMRAAHRTPAPATASSSSLQNPLPATNPQNSNTSNSHHAKTRATKVAECSAPVGFRSPEQLHREVVERQRLLARRIQKQHQIQSAPAHFVTNGGSGPPVARLEDDGRPFNPRPIRQQLLAKRKLESQENGASNNSYSQEQSEPADGAIVAASKLQNSASKEGIKEFIKQQVKKRHKEQMLLKQQEEKRKEEIQKRLTALSQYRRKQGFAQMNHNSHASNIEKHVAAPEDKLDMELGEIVESQKIYTDALDYINNHGLVETRLSETPIYESLNNQALQLSNIFPQQSATENPSSSNFTGRLHTNSIVDASNLHGSIPTQSASMAAIQQHMAELDWLHLMMQSAPSAEDPTIQKVHTIGEEKFEHCDLDKQAPSWTGKQQQPTDSGNGQYLVFPNDHETHQIVSEQGHQQQNAQMLYLRTIFQKALEIDKRLKQNPQVLDTLLNLTKSHGQRDVDSNVHTEFQGASDFEADTGFFINARSRSSSMDRSPVGKQYMTEIFPRSLPSSNPQISALGALLTAPQQHNPTDLLNRSPRYPNALAGPPAMAWSLSSSRRDSLESVGIGMIADFAASDKRVRSLSRRGRARERTYGQREADAAVIVQRWIRGYLKSTRLRRRRVDELMVVDDVSEDWRKALDDDLEDYKEREKIGTAILGGDRDDPYSSVFKVLDRVKPDFVAELAAVVPENKFKVNEDNDINISKVLEEPVGVLGSQSKGTSIGAVLTALPAPSPEAKVTTNIAVTIDTQSAEYSDRFESESGRVYTPIRAEESTTVPDYENVADPTQNINEVINIDESKKFTSKQASVLRDSVKQPSLENINPQEKSKLANIGTEPIYTFTHTEENFTSTSSDLIFETDTDTETEVRNRRKRSSNRNYRSNERSNINHHQDEFHGLSPRSLARKFDNESRHLDVLDMASEQISELQRTHLFSINQQETLGLTHMVRQMQHDKHLQDLEEAKRQRELAELRLKGMTTATIVTPPAIVPSFFTKTTYDYGNDFEPMTEVSQHKDDISSFGGGASSAQDLLSSVSSFKGSNNILLKGQMHDTSDASMADESMVDFESLINLDHVRVPETEEEYFSALNAREKFAKEYAQKEIKMELDRLQRVAGLSTKERHHRLTSFHKMVKLRLMTELADIERSRRAFKTSSQTVHTEKPIPKQPESKLSKEVPEIKKSQPLLSSTSIPEDIHDDKVTGASYMSIPEEIDLAHHANDSSFGTESISIAINGSEELNAKGSTTPTPARVATSVVLSAESKESGSNTSTISSIVSKLQKIGAYVSNVSNLERKKERLEKSKIVGEKLLSEAEQKQTLQREISQLQEHIAKILQHSEELIETDKKLSALKADNLAIVGQSKSKRANRKSTHSAINNRKITTYEIEEDLPFNEPSVTSTGSIPLEIDADINSFNSSIKSIAESIHYEIEQVQKNLNESIVDKEITESIRSEVESVEKDLGSLIDEISSYGGGAGSVESKKSKTTEAVAAADSYLGSLDSKLSTSVRDELDTASYMYEEDFEETEILNTTPIVPQSKDVPKDTPESSATSDDSGLRQLSDILKEKRKQLEALEIERKQVFKKAERKKKEAVLRKELEALDSKIYLAKINIQAAQSAADSSTTPDETPVREIEPFSSSSKSAQRNHTVESLNTAKNILPQEHSTIEPPPSITPESKHGLGNNPSAANQSLPHIADDISSYGASASSLVSQQSPLAVPQEPQAIKSAKEYEDDFLSASEASNKIDSESETPVAISVEAKSQNKVETEDIQADTVEEEIGEEIEGEYEDDFSNDMGKVGDGLIKFTDVVSDIVVSNTEEAKHFSLEDSGPGTQDVSYSVAGFEPRAQLADEVHFTYEDQTDVNMLIRGSEGVVEMEQALLEPRTTSAPVEKSITNIQTHVESADPEYTLEEKDACVVAVPREFDVVANAVEANDDESKLHERANQVADLILGDILNESVEAIHDVQLELPITQSPLLQEHSLDIDKSKSELSLAEKADKISEQIFADMLSELQESIESAVNFGSLFQPEKKPILPDFVEVLSNKCNESVNKSDASVTAGEKSSVGASIGTESLSLEQLSHAAAGPRSESTFENTYGTAIVPRVEGHVGEIIEGTAVASIKEAAVETKPDTILAISGTPQSSSPLLTKLTEILAKGILLTSSEFTVEFTRIVLSYLPKPDTHAGYTRLPEFPEAVVDELTGGADSPHEDQRHLDNALRVRYVLLLESVKEALRDVFCLHIAAAVRGQQEAKYDVGDGIKKARVVVATEFSTPDITIVRRRQSMLSLLPPRPLTLEQVKLKTEVLITGWGKYSELHGTNLDNMLIESVQRDEELWRDLDVGMDSVKQRCFEEVLEDVVTDSIDGMLGAAK